MSSMSNNGCVDVTKDSFLAARRAWPGRGHDDRLSAPVRRVFDSWMAVSEDDRLTALDAAVREGFARRPGRDSPRAQCQDLTLSGSPLPVAHANVRLLTAEQIRAMGDPGTEPPRAVRNSDNWVDGTLVPRRGRQTTRVVTPAAGNDVGEEAEERSHSAPPNASRERGASVRSSSRDSSPSRPESVGTDRRVDELLRRIAAQDERIRQLFDQQLAEPNEDVSSAYIVMDEVWQKLGKDAATDRCSWLNVNALKKREVSEVIRTHSGTFPHFPCELDVIGAMKKLPGVADAKISLVDFAQTEVAKFMRANARTVRLSGTSFSRTLEFQQQLADYLDNDPQATEVSLEWVLEFVDKVVGVSRGAFALSIDTQTALRLAVSTRLEKAMKVDHLTANPLKAEREDFVPPVVIKRIEDAAKRNLDLTWALDQASGKQSFSGRHPANSSRGGKADYARQRGRGGGAGKGSSKGAKGQGRGKGRGKGRGAAATPRAEAHADASLDE